MFNNIVNSFNDFWDNINDVLFSISKNNKRYINNSNSKISDYTDLMEFDGERDKNKQDRSNSNNVKNNNKDINKNNEHINESNLLDKIKKYFIKNKKRFSIVVIIFLIIIGVFFISQTILTDINKKPNNNLSDKEKMIYDLLEENGKDNNSDDNISIEEEIGLKELENQILDKYNKRAIEEDDVDVCNNLQNFSNRVNEKNTQSNTSEANTNTNNGVNNNLVQQCKDNYLKRKAINNSDMSICDNIDDSNIMLQCKEMIINREVRKITIDNFDDLNKDILKDICSTSSNFINKKCKKDKKERITDKINSGEDIKYCNLFGDEKEKNNCIDEYNLQKGRNEMSINYCSKIKDRGKLNNCIDYLLTNLLGANNNKKYCRLYLSNNKYKICVSEAERRIEQGKKHGLEEYHKKKLQQIYRFEIQKGIYRGL